MLAKRSVTDYTLQRRATLAALGRGLTSSTEVCDADPYLLRAALHHGEATERDCPVCRKRRLVTLNYVYGDELGPFQGRIKAGRELERMAAEHGEFHVYEVEVCVECSWNHLTSSYVLGDGTPRRPLRAARGDSPLF